MYPWASDQLKKRSEILSKPTRSEEEVNYLGNKGAWIRVVSSVNLEESFSKYFKDQYGAFTGITDDFDVLFAENLAKNFILFGGTSVYESRLRSGISLGGAYAILGDKEVKDYGYRPMPGITAVTIESTGRMGSLRQATVNFRVSDKMQLDVMDALYFRPGFSVLIEYGHAKYINNKGELKSTEELMINPFKTTDKENIGIEISRNIQKSAGNYGGMLSVITSFNFSMTPDGGYDCVLKTIALGGVMGNYPINKLESLPSIYIKQLKAFLDKQRKEKEAAERAAAEAAAKAELNNLPKTASDNWNDLQIKDPLSNLIYNIYPEWFEKLPSTTKKVTPNPPPPPVTPREAAIWSAGNTSFTYSKSGIEGSIPNFKTVSLIQNQNQYGGEVTAYVVNEGRGKTSSGATIFIEDSSFGKTMGFPTYISNVSGRYLAAGNYSKQNGLGDIYVNIDPSRIYAVFSKSRTDSKPNINIVGSFPVLQKQATDGGIGDFTNWFDAIISFPGTANVGGDYSVTYFPGDEATVNTPSTAEAARPRYNISIDSDEDIDKARAVYTNPKTEWKIDSIKTFQFTNNQVIISLSADNNKYRIRLGAEVGDRGETYRNADLSFISNIIKKDPNQNLIINKVALQAEEINKRVATKIQDIKNRYQIETDAKTLQALASSQSAIELMLRSISLYAISQQKPDVTLDDKFIKDLFSEGAYSKIFKKISRGKLPAIDYTQKDFNSYIDGSMNVEARLEVNLRYGNSAYLMSAENVTSENVNLLEIIPQVELANLFKVKQLPYGEAADVLVDDAPKVSIYISLGLFLLMLNHCSMLYNTGKQGDTVVPMTYVDFNPSTNYYLSSINQFSIDPFSFIMPYYGNDTHYKKLFKPGIINSNNQIELKVSGSSIQPHSVFKFSNDRLSRGLLNNKIDINGKSDGYIGRTMDTLVNVNFLLKKIKDYSTSSDFGETYFQSILENITATLNKSTGYYNAFRLSYSDSANTYMIVDDQVQLKPDPKVKSLQYDIINPSTSTLAPEIPIQGKGSIARSFEIRTDISNRISSMLAISTNTGAGKQVGMGKNMGDFGVYNIGSYDRYMPIKISESSSIAPQNNIQECQAAINFDTVVTTIYGLSSNQNKEILSNQQVQNAMAYYKERMARVKNEQPQSVSAMIIPIRTSITMDGFSGIYPFQLFTVNESVLPYRYSSKNLNNGKVAFTTTKITHNFSNNEWVTSMDGLMTFLKDATDEQETAVIAPGPIEVNIVSAARITYTSIVANSKEIYDFFIAQGFTNFQAAAWVGNLNQESGLDPTRVNSKGAIGIAQWLYPSRKNGLITRPGYNTLQVQLDYIMEELNSAEFSGIYNEIKATTDISSATLVIRTEYEKPGESEANDIARLSYAEFIFEKFNKI